MDNFTDRPTRANPTIQKFATSDLAKRLSEEWAAQSFSQEKWERMLEKVGVCNARDRNGYDLARDLDQISGIRPDLELVEILDDAPYFLDMAHTEAVKQWVKFHNLTLSRTLGERVSTPWGEGTITRLKPDTAAYIVTPDNDPTFARGGGWVVEAERCEAVVNTDQLTLPPQASEVQHANSQ